MDFGYIFIDLNDNHLKVKKSNDSIVEFPVDLSEISLLYSVYVTDTTTTNVNLDLRGGTIVTYTQPLARFNIF